MDSSNKRRKVIHSEGRQIIAKVYHFLKEEYEFTNLHQEPNCDLSHLRNITKRTSEATGVSGRTVQTILKEERDIAGTSSKFLSPMKKRRKRENKTVETADNQSDDIGSDGGAGGDCDKNLAPTQDPDTSNSAQSETSLHDKEGELHNILCNECQGQIIGFRYVCVQCLDWDMCSGCEARAAHSHHYVLRLPGPRPQAKVQSLITAIQEQLHAFFDTALRMEPIIEEIKMECDMNIKEEPADVEDESIVPQQSQFIEITIAPEVKITQNIITKMEDNLEQAISSILPDEQETPTTVQQKDILEQAVYSVLPDEQETPITIKEEPTSTSIAYTFPPETKLTPSYSDVTTDAALPQQSSSHTIVYSTHKPAIKKKRYK